MQLDLADVRMPDAFVTLPRDENQARGIGQYAIDFLAGKFAGPSASFSRWSSSFIWIASPAAFRRWPAAPTHRACCAAKRWSIACPTAAPACRCFGSRVRVMPEKAVVANSSAVREWDANGTNFGYNPARGATRGEFGHNDFYPVAVAAAQLRGLDGRQTLRAMILLDEIRGRLAEVFALKDYKIDHVVHGAIASAAVYGAVLGATAEQIESAIGLVVAHYIPFRAIRAGKQLSDSKGASAAISAEVAVLSMRRAMRGFVGPADIFRNPEAIFCLFEKPAEKDTSPFDLTLATARRRFRRDGHALQAGAVRASIGRRDPGPDGPAGRASAACWTIRQQIKSDSRSRSTSRRSASSATRPSATRARGKAPTIRWSTSSPRCCARRSRQQQAGLARIDARAGRLRRREPRRIRSRDGLMERIEFRHGGREYDAKYPDGIPTTLEIEHADLGRLSSGLVMYPEGHARNTSGNLDGLLEHKFRALAGAGRG